MKLMCVRKGAACAAGLILPLLLFAMAGCGGVGTGGGTTPAALVDVTGSWEVTETITEASGVCEGSVNEVSAWTFDAVQELSSLTATITSGEREGTVLTGIVSADKINWHGTYPAGGGTTTITSSNIQVYLGTLNGTENWEWTDGVENCSGKARVIGSKL